MKPAWDKLMKEYTDHPTIVIADVDCTADGKSLCDKNEVQGFPTIKFGDPDNLEDYEGGRDLKDLKEFAKANLGPKCGPANLDLCDAEKKAQIEKFMGMDGAALTAAIEEKEGLMKDENSKFEKAVEGLQATYEELSKKKDENIKAVKESGLGLMKSVLAHSKKTEKGEL